MSETVNDHGSGEQLSTPTRNTGAKHQFAAPTSSAVSISTSPGGTQHVLTCFVCNLQFDSKAELDGHVVECAKNEARKSRTPQPKEKALQSIEPLDSSTVAATSSSGRPRKDSLMEQPRNQADDDDDSDVDVVVELASPMDPPVALPPQTKRPEANLVVETTPTKQSSSLDLGDQPSPVPQPVSQPSMLAASPNGGSEGRRLKHSSSSADSKQHDNDPNAPHTPPSAVNLSNVSFGDLNTSVVSGRDSNASTPPPGTPTLQEQRRNIREARGSGTWAANKLQSLEELQQENMNRLVRSNSAGSHLATPAERTQETLRRLRSSPALETPPSPVSIPSLQLSPMNPLSPPAAGAECELPPAAAAGVKATTSSNRGLPSPKGTDASSSPPQQGAVSLEERMEREILERVQRQDRFASPKRVVSFTPETAATGGPSERSGSVRSASVTSARPSTAAAASAKKRAQSTERPRSAAASVKAPTVSKYTDHSPLRRIQQLHAPSTESSPNGNTTTTRSGSVSAKTSTAFTRTSGVGNRVPPPNAASTGRSASVGTKLKEDQVTPSTGRPSAPSARTPTTKASLASTYSGSSGSMAAAAKRSASVGERRPIYQRPTEASRVRAKQAEEKAKAAHNTVAQNAVSRPTPPTKATSTKAPATVTSTVTTRLRQERASKLAAAAAAASPTANAGPGPLNRKVGPSSSSAPTPTPKRTKETSFANVNLPHRRTAGGIQVASGSTTQSHQDSANTNTTTRSTTGASTARTTPAHTDAAPSRNLRPRPTTQPSALPPTKRSTASPTTSIRHASPKRSASPLHTSRSDVPPPPQSARSVSAGAEIAPTSGVAFCASCGKKYMDGARFCAFCGHKREMP